MLKLKRRAEDRRPMSVTFKEETGDKKLPKPGRRTKARAEEAVQRNAQRPVSYRHGAFTREAIAERRAIRQLLARILSPL